MIKDILTKKEIVLFIILSGVFISTALISEMIGVKIFSLEKTFGFEPTNFHFFDQKGLSFNLTIGVILWPVVFIMTDIINEYYGKHGVRFLSYLTVVLIAFAFLMFYLAINVVPADFWPQSHIHSDYSATEKQFILNKVGDLNYAYKLILGQGAWIIVGSLIAFLIGQFIDVIVFQRIKIVTGENKIWLRATGSTIISQLIDSFVVLFIAFYIGAGWDFNLVLAIGLMNYIYKFTIAIILTPLIYILHDIIEKYLGDDLASKMRYAALHNL
ncbi:MAG: queuosine precursor transporter [Saprospiraceae bacterium]|nr:queuosine precursor transporter [Saprospiraceae bacterium]